MVVPRYGTKGILRTFVCLLLPSLLIPRCKRYHMQVNGQKTCIYIDIRICIPTELDICICICLGSNNMSFFATQYLCLYT